jgi:hypothetical protein
MYILLDIDKDCDLLHDRPVLSTGRMPHDKTATGLDAKTDRLDVSCKVTVTMASFYKKLERVFDQFP